MIPEEKKKIPFPEPRLGQLLRVTTPRLACFTNIPEPSKDWLERDDIIWLKKDDVVIMVERDYACPGARVRCLTHSGLMWLNVRFIREIT